MNRPQLALAGAVFALVVPLTGAPAAAAEPLTPLTAPELQYLGQLRQVFATYRDPAEFRSDGELLDQGHLVCVRREKGLVGYEATLITPAVVQLALIYLCPT